MAVGGRNIGLIMVIGDLGAYHVQPVELVPDEVVGVVTPQNGVERTSGPDVGTSWIDALSLTECPVILPSARLRSVGQAGHRSCHGRLKARCR